MGQKAIVIGVLVTIGILFLARKAKAAPAPTDDDQYTTEEDQWIGPPEAG